ncbi:hypothetical protein SFC15_17345 [Shouchella clausii]
MMSKVTVKVSGVNFLYSDDTLEKVEVSFYTKDASEEIYANGRIPIEPDVYFANSGLEQLSSLVRDEVIARLEAKEEPQEPEEPEAE